MSVSRSELYLNTRPEKSADMRAADGDFFRAGISPYTIYENRIPKWSFPNIRLWSGSVDKEQTFELEKVKAMSEKWKAVGRKIGT